MKKILFIIGLFFSVNGFSQVYHPIPSDSVYWIESSGGIYDGGGFYCAASTYSYIYPYNSSVLLDSNYYIEFHENTFTTYQLVYGSGTCPSSLSGGGLYAYIRNDSLNKKVYFYDWLGSHLEYLIYDFDLNLGDTISYPGFHGGFSACPEDTVIVQRVDSIDIGGEFRKRYGIVSGFSGFDTISIIESIGIDKGFVYPQFCAAEATSNLICYHNKLLEYYPLWDGSGSCIINFDLNPPTLGTTNIIFANSSFSYFINNPENNEINISCYDILGKFILQKSFHESSYLDLNDLTSGIYFMDIMINGKPIKPYKFIITH